MAAIRIDSLYASATSHGSNSQSNLNSIDFGKSNGSRERIGSSENLKVCHSNRPYVSAVFKKSVEAQGRLWHLIIPRIPKVM